MQHIIEDPSPNFGPRRGARRVELVVIHYTAMARGAEALARLKDPAAEVSAHYFVSPGGEVRRLVAEDMRAWHAGVAVWGGVRDVNSRSIGIELDHRGHDGGNPPFAEPQMRALETLLAGLLARHALPAAAVLGHSDVAPDRKVDPGEKFDWRRLARAGLSVWLDPTAMVAGAADAGAFQEAATAVRLWRAPERDLVRRHADGSGGVPAPVPAGGARGCSGCAQRGAHAGAGRALAGGGERRLSPERGALARPLRPARAPARHLPHPPMLPLHGLDRLAWPTGRRRAGARALLVRCR